MSSSTILAGVSHALIKQILFKSKWLVPLASVLAMEMRDKASKCRLPSRNLWTKHIAGSMEKCGPMIKKKEKNFK